MMKLNDKGLALIKQWEGFRSKPYLDPVGIPTIGYGTITYPDGRKVTIKDAPVTEAQATQYLLRHIATIEPLIVKALEVKLNDNRYSAIVSFVYNLGIGNFRRSTLLQTINAAPGAPGIRTEFMKWVNANGRKLEGLVKRRTAEADLYFTPIQCPTCGHTE